MAKTKDREKFGYGDWISCDRLTKAGFDVVALSHQGVVSDLVYHFGHEGRGMVKVLKEIKA